MLNCLIIEDQIPAQEILQKYIGQVPYLELLNTYISPIEAMETLESGTVDVLFLDIHLPKISGLELLKLLRQPPLIILTTAFSEYAVQGFELDVVDYLLKPYSFKRFLKAISKVQHLTSHQNNKPSTNRQHLFVRNKYTIQKIAIKDILFVEAKGDYVLIYTPEKYEIASTSLQDILPKMGPDFIRCHKSYIINIAAIEKIVGNQILIHKRQIPIGRTYKEHLLEKIKMV